MSSIDSVPLIGLRVKGVSRQVKCNSDLYRLNLGRHPLSFSFVRSRIATYYTIYATIEYLYCSREAYYIKSFEMLQDSIKTIFG